jgi:alkyl hydroperoxide reductase subunit AhpC
MEISKKYGILDEERGIPYRFVFQYLYFNNNYHFIITIVRAMFIIDDSGILRQITINDSNIARDVLETQRIIEAIQESNELRKNSIKPDYLAGKQSSHSLCIQVIRFVFFFSA